MKYIYEYYILQTSLKMAFVAFNSFQRMVSNKTRATAGGGGHCIS